MFQTTNQIKGTQKSIPYPSDEIFSKLVSFHSTGPHHPLPSVQSGVSSCGRWAIKPLYYRYIVMQTEKDRKTIYHSFLRFFLTPFWRLLCSQSYEVVLDVNVGDNHSN